MSYPTRGAAQVTWTPPEAVPQADTYGRGYNHYFTDMRQEGADANVAGTPPTPEQAYWRKAVTDDVLYIPELRGAILEPKRCPVDVGSYLIPCKNGLGHPPYTFLDRWKWGTPEAPDSDWRTKRHEELGLDVGQWSPATFTAPATGVLRTREQEPDNRSFMLFYQLFTPPKSVQSLAHLGLPYGLNIYLGIQQGVAQYKLSFPNPHPDVQSTNWWQLWACDNTGRPFDLLDRIPQPTAKSVETQAHSSVEWLMVIPVADRLLIRSSRTDTAWVFAPPDGVSIREGHIAYEIVNTRGWLLPCAVLYAPTAVIQGPPTDVPDWVTPEAEARVSADAFTYLDPDLAEWVPEVETVGEYVDTSERDGDGALVGSASGYVKVTVNNLSPEESVTVGSDTRTGCTRTPVLYSVQEVHRTVLNNVEPNPVDLSVYGVRFTASYEEGGLGATGSITFRDWEQAVPNGPYTFGVVSSQVRGLGQLSVDLKHLYPAGQDDAPEVDFARVFTGWVTKRKRSYKGIFPQLECSLADHSWILMDQRATCAFLPDLSGWDAKEAITLALTHWEVPEANIVFPSDYADLARTIPRQKGGAGGGLFSVGDSVLSAVAKICSLCDLSFCPTLDGLYRFRWTPAVMGSPAFVLDETTATEEDQILECDLSDDYHAARSVFHCLGKTEYGQAVEVHLTWEGLVTDPTQAGYVGRKVWAVNFDDADADPSKTAERLMYAARQGTGNLSWGTIGRDVWPGDIVEFRLPRLDLPSGTLFRVKSKTITLECGSGDALWRETYTGEYTLPGGHYV